MQIVYQQERSTEKNTFPYLKATVMKENLPNWALVLITKSYDNRYINVFVNVIECILR